MTTILVIEDETPIRENLVALLDAEGYEVISAANGRIGVEMARQRLPDLILCDVLMPELDGHGVYQELHQDPVTALIPFIFLTARATPADLRAGMALGADDYLTKPFTRDDLLRSVTTRLAKRTKITQYVQAKLDELRQSIARMLPHELRTPLTVIVGYSSILSENYDSLQPDELREIAEALQQAGQRLSRLIQRFLLNHELTQIVEDPEQVQMLRDQRVQRTAALVERVARQQAQKADRMADLDLNLQDGPARIEESHLTYLLEELIENAFKFSPAGTPVRVNSKVSGDAVTITITDQGRGMTAAQMAEIGAYVQLERRRYEQQGQGLGLVLARRIAELYGGRLTLHSIPDQGTTVSVELPR